MANDKQRAYWTDIAGPKWLSLAGSMEARLAAVNEALIAAASPRPGERVIDIGCGAGRTTRAAAQAVGPSGQVLGADISPPMLEAARIFCADLAQVRFALADAQTHAFDPQADVILSRFGVMFFEDPVAAFANLRRATRQGGRLAFACWAPLAQNPHWQLPLAIIESLVGPGAPRIPHAPGPLAFDEPDYVASLLARAGWSAIAITPVGVPILGRDLDDKSRVACFMGPGGALLDEKKASEETRAAARAAIRDALPGIATPGAGGEIALPATVFLVTAS